MFTHKSNRKHLLGKIISGKIRSEDNIYFTRIGLQKRRSKIFFSFLYNRLKFELLIYNLFIFPGKTVRSPQMN